MKLAALSWPLRAAAAAAVGLAFAGAVYLAAQGGGSGGGPSAQLAATPTATPVPERVPQPERPPPQPTFVPPVITPRSVVPGLDKGGLFADGVKDLPKVDTSDWLTYRNDKWGYSFKYPPGWELEEQDNSGLSAYGRPAWPRQWVRVLNPASERGRNIPGVNCAAITCEAANPGTLNFAVAIEAGPSCSIPGQLVVNDVWTIAANAGKRCVVIHPAGTPIVSMGFPSPNNLTLSVVMEKGRETTPSGQAILEAILSTLTITP